MNQRLKTILFIPVLLLIGIIANAQPLSWQWVNTPSGPDSIIDGAVVNSMSSDVYGNFYITGDFRSPTLTFGNITMVDADTSWNIFLVKFDSSGNPLWAVNAGGNSVGTAVSADANGNVYLAGYFTNYSMVFGTDTLTGNEGHGESLIAKYASTGDLMWVKSTDGTPETYTYNNASGISTDGNGNVYVAGIFGGPKMVLDNLTVQNPSNNDAIFLAKYDPTGNLIWFKGGWSTSVNYTLYLNDDGEGNSYLQVDFSGATITLDNITLNNINAVDGIAIAKFNSSGNILWAKSAGVTSNQVLGAGISFDNSGNVYTTGNFSSPTLILGNVTLTNLANAGTNDMFLAKYNASGTLQWAKNGLGASTAQSLNIDNNDNLYVTGDFTGNLVFGKDTLVNTQSGGLNTDIFIAEYDSSGKSLWGTRAIGSGFDYAIGASINNEASIYVTGLYNDSTTIFGSDTLFAPQGSSNPQYNIFIAKLGTSTTGINTEETAQNIISVFPNPSTGQSYFKGLMGPTLLEIYDVLGQKIYSSTISSDTYLLNLNGNVKGIYSYRITNAIGTIQQGKIILD